MCRVENFYSTGSLFIFSLFLIHKKEDYPRSVNSRICTGLDES